MSEVPAVDFALLEMVERITAEHEPTTRGWWLWRHTRHPHAGTRIRGCARCVEDERAECADRMLRALDSGLFCANAGRLVIAASDLAEAGQYLSRDEPEPRTFFDLVRDVIGALEQIKHGAA